MLALMMGFSLALAGLEVGLRIWNPFEFRVKHGRIILPADKTYRLTNSSIHKLDSLIVHRKNALGFRGPNPPNDLSKTFSILTVGGSTTECFYLSDEEAWPQLLSERLKPHLKSLWLNNAGLDGHSTVGHLVLMKDVIVKLHPNLALFLVGLNDSCLREDARDLEALSIRHGLDLSAPKRLLKSVAQYSEVAALMENLIRSLRASRAGLQHHEVEFDSIQAKPVSEEEKASAMAQHRERYLGPYTDRLRQLAAICEAHDIVPVFITQPALLGARFWMAGPGQGYWKNLAGTDLELSWEILEMYNQATRDVAEERGIFLVDLAETLPKDEAFYYDWFHFTPSGAQGVADIISKGLQVFLSDKGLWKDGN